MLSPISPRLSSPMYSHQRRLRNRLTSTRLATILLLHLVAFTSFLQLYNRNPTKLLEQYVRESDMERTIEIGEEKHTNTSTPAESNINDTTEEEESVVDEMPISEEVIKTTGHIEEESVIDKEPNQNIQRTEHPHTNTTTTTTEETSGIINFQYDNPLYNFTLPKWIDDFLQNQPIETHLETLADLNQKFIVLTCHKFNNIQEEKCGGLADRLIQIPHYLWLANQTGRKLLIKYTTPHPLEEYLVPPEGGFDWRLPDEYCEKELEKYASRDKNTYVSQRWAEWHKNIDNWKDRRFLFVNNNLRIAYKKNPIRVGLQWDEDPYIFAGIFRRMFQPSKPVANMIDTFVNDVGLVPGTFAVTHIRALYDNGVHVSRGLNFKDKTIRQQAHEMADNAISCTMMAMPESKSIYLATDSNQIAQYLLDESPHWSKDHSSSNVSILVRPDITNVGAHFQNSKSPGVSDLYPTFFDLWIMSHSKCLAQGVGGFGHLASLLSGNHHECRVRHRSKDEPYTMRTCPSYNEFHQHLLEYHKEQERMHEDELKIKKMVLQTVEQEVKLQQEEVEKHKKMYLIHVGKQSTYVNDDDDDDDSGDDDTS